METTQATLQIAHFIYNSRQLRPVSLAGWIATIDWMLDDLASAASRSALVLTGDVGDETMVSHCTPTAICSYFDPAPLTLHWLVITYSTVWLASGSCTIRCLLLPPIQA